MTDLPTPEAVLAVAREKHLTVSAASVAFHAFNALVALSVLLYVAFTVLGTGTALAGLLEVLTGVGAAEFERLFEQVGTEPDGRRRAAAIAVVIAVWSSLRLFGVVESIFTELYERRQRRSTARWLLDSVLVFVAVTLLLAVTVAVGSLFLFRLTGLAGVVLGPLALWLALCALLFPVYYRFPGSDVSVRESLPGTAAAAAGWTVSAIGLRAYVTVSESVDLYGVVGGVLLVLTWVYVVGVSSLLGAVLNAVLADRIEPDPAWSPFRE